MFFHKHFLLFAAKKPTSSVSWKICRNLTTNPDMIAFWVSVQLWSFTLSKEKQQFIFDSSRLVLELQVVFWQGFRKCSHKHSELRVCKTFSIPRFSLNSVLQLVSKLYLAWLIVHYDTHCWLFFYIYSRLEMDLNYFCNLLALTMNGSSHFSFVGVLMWPESKRNCKIN